MPPVAADTAEPSAFEAVVHAACGLRTGERVTRAARAFQELLRCALFKKRVGIDLHEEVAGDMVEQFLGRPRFRAHESANAAPDVTSLAALVDKARAGDLPLSDAELTAGNKLLYRYLEACVVRRAIKLARRAKRFIAIPDEHPDAAPRHEALACYPVDRLEGESLMWVRARVLDALRAADDTKPWMLEALAQIEGLATGELAMGTLVDAALAADSARASDDAARKTARDMLQKRHMRVRNRLLELVDELADGGALDEEERALGERWLLSLKRRQITEARASKEGR